MLLLLLLCSADAYVTIAAAALITNCQAPGGPVLMICVRKCAYVCAYVCMRECCVLLILHTYMHIGWHPPFYNPPESARAKLTNPDELPCKTRPDPTPPKCHPPNAAWTSAPPPPQPSSSVCVCVCLCARARPRRKKSIITMAISGGSPKYTNTKVLAENAATAPDVSWMLCRPAVPTKVGAYAFCCLLLAISLHTPSYGENKEP